MRKTMITTVSAALLSCGAQAADSAAIPPLYKDARAPVTERVEDLLGRMTLDEKLAQLQSVWHQRRQMESSGMQFLPEKAKALIPHGIGHIGRPSEYKTPRQMAEFNNAVQRWLAEQTRLGIPALMHEEALHGYVAYDATSFPQAMALASSWSPADLEKLYALAAREMRATGAHWALAPVLDIGRDPRWGRIEETMGEDPYLVSALGIAAVRGFQGLASKEAAFAEDKVVATLKHLTGHGQPQAGVNTAPAHIAPRELQEVFLAPFEAAIKKAYAASIMPSYNEVDGVPSHINSYLLRELARDQWGFNGAVVSDYFAVQELRSRHQLFASEAEAAKAALLAGVDMETPDPKTFPLLKALVEKGELPVSAIDQAVRPVLALKFRLGLFEKPYVDESKADAALGSAEGRQLALQLAEASIVLLKNDGTLPLDAHKLKSLALIGAHADEALLGGYSSIPRQTVSLKSALEQQLQGKVAVTFARGSRITDNNFLEPKASGSADSTDTSSTNALAEAAARAVVERSHKAGTYSMLRWNHDETVLASPASNAELRAEAVALAKRSDAIVLVLGENEGLAREAWADKHLGDRPSLELSADQQLLAKEVLAVAADKPLVLVLSNGRPLALGALAEQMPAIVEAWYLGQEGGTALANVLLGNVNPSGKLPLSFPRSAGHIPLFYNHKASSSRGYLHDDIQPLYPFGHGLSYSQFDYSNLQLNKTTAKAGEEVEVSLQLKNSGSREGTEVVQLYVQDPVASLTRPVQQLAGFARVSLQPGEQKTVRFRLPVNLLAFLGPQQQGRMPWLLEPGEIRLQLGSSSADIRLRGRFEVVGPAADVSNDRALQSTVQIVD
ncbi:glycoside hydrolase family 3 N-terminal domain-containing protein [Rheinheimera sp.]|uniref:glycoside hydrolase family 3 N-terminal domain-containing protein n=1 Tax=Rheinheimera sp. TaxID=1869214 RepID=UPI00307D8280